MIELTAHFLLLVFFPPLLLGIINKTKALSAGRRGAPLLQTYYDLFKLFRKGLLVSTTTTWIFKAGPFVGLVTVFAASLFLPQASLTSPLSFTGDFVVFSSLFSLNRYLTTMAALDTGSSFEGMGSSRDLRFAVLSEPALFFVFLVLARLSSSFSLSQMLAALPQNFANSFAPSILLSVISLFLVLLAETSRIPVDDPTTHLELTMVHEAMTLDHSGPLLAIINYAAGVKLFVLGSLFLKVLFPFRTGIFYFDFLMFVSELGLLALGIAFVESIMARLRLKRVPYFLVAALLLGGTAFILLLR